jgi:dipeptidyl aminopeptidase/acylaminoacyl peptidase
VNGLKVWLSLCLFTILSVCPTGWAQPANSTPMQPSTNSKQPPSSQDALADRVRAMLSMGKCNFPAFSPDDKTVCFVSDMSGSPQLWLVPVGGGWPTQITGAGVSIIGEQWSFKTDWLAFLAGDGDREVCLVRADGSGYKATGIKGGLTDWTSDGKRLILSTKREGIKANCFLLDPETEALEPIADENADLVYDITNDGRFALTCKFESNYESNLYLYDLNKHRQELLTPHKGQAHCGGGWTDRSRARFSPDGRTILFVTNVDRKKTGLARIKLSEDGAPGPVEYIVNRDDAELEGFAINDDATRAALAWNGSEAGKVSLVDIKSGKSTPLPELPPGSVSEITISHRGSTVAVSLHSMLVPEDIWVNDVGNDKWRQLTYAQHPAVNLAKIARPEKISFKSADGIMRDCEIFRPRNQHGPAPYVLALGGSGWSNSPAEHAALAEEGIGVFIPPKVANPHDKGHEAFERLKLVKECVDYLVKNGIADPKRIGVTGHSQYGYLTLAAVTEFPNMFAACVERSGWVDFATFMKYTSPGWAKFMHSEFGDPSQNPELMEVLSPIRRLDRVTAAIMVQHGAQDSNVPPEEAQQVVDYFKKRNVQVEALIVPDEGHNFMKRSNQVKSSVALIDFFVRHLTPEVN